MIELIEEESDAPQFLHRVQAVMIGAVRVSGCKQVHVVKIDNWFSSKWTHFSGKALGLVGIWNRELTLPPFVPNRVVEERRYLADPESGEYRLVETAPKLHRRQEGDANIHRFASRIAPETALFWYSGNSRVNGRGSFMAYLPTPEDYEAWHVDLREDKQWQPGRMVDITARLLAALEEAGTSEA